MNWVLASMGVAKTGMQLGSDLSAIGGTMLEGAAAQSKIAANISRSMADQLSYKMQAKNFGRAAEDAVKAAGRAQEQGAQSRESRLTKLGQDKGQIVAGAAGSGLDVSSHTVRKTLKDTIKSAYNDAATIAQNEHDIVQERLNESTTAEENRIWAEYNANIEQLNQNLMFAQSQLQAKATRNAIIGGALSATANFLGGAANTGALATMK